VTALYQNNRLTYAADLGILYSVTAKIDVAAGAHYTRAHLVSATSDPLGVSAVESTDHRKLFFIGANYEFLRNATATCRLARELHDVSGRQRLRVRLDPLRLLGPVYVAMTESCCAYPLSARRI
jgi:hypothetical protein